MPRLLLVKVLRDLRTIWGRMLMMLVAVSISLVAFGGMVFAGSITLTNQLEDYISTNPASARIEFVQGVRPDQVATLAAIAKQEPDVTGATMRSVLVLQAQVQNQNSSTTPLELFVAAPTDPMRIASFNLEQGTWPPANGTMLMERSALKLFNLRVGDTVKVTNFDNRPVTLVISGVVHDQSLAPANEGDQGYGYITTNTLPVLGKPSALNQLEITVAGRPGQTTLSHNRDAIVRTARNVAKRLKEELPGTQVLQIDVPQPYQHPHQDQANALMGALAGFGALALVLSAILIATMFNGLFTQQIPQIGMLKAIGARSRQVMLMYTLMVLAVAVTATALAIAPGIALGQAIAQLVLTSAVNADVTTLSLPWWTYLTLIAAGVGIPLLTALGPLLSASRRTVRQALDERGVDRPGRAINNWLGRSRRIDRMLLMAFRNTFRRRARLWLSVGLLTAAGTIFVGGSDVSAGVEAVPRTIAAEQRWDVEVKPAAPVDATTFQRIVAKVPHVTDVEAWNTAPTSVEAAGSARVTTTYPDQGHGSLNLNALPSVGATAVFKPPTMLEGRWLDASDTDAIVVPQSIRRVLPGVRVGQSLQLPINNRLTAWKVAGIAEELAGGTCPCVTEAGFEQATGQVGKSTLLLVATDSHDSATRDSAGAAIKRALDAAGIRAGAQSFSSLIGSAEEHTGVLLILVLLIASIMGAVGLIGLGSMMSTNVIERTREFGIMSAIGAPGSAVRRLVVLEGVFTSALSCVVAVIPVWLVTSVLDAGLGGLFFNASLPFEVSGAAVGAWLIVVIGGATVATWAPASRAARMTVRAALAYL
jgi:putative ABC transport system permease protein